MSSPTPPEKKSEFLSTELRMVLAFVLMGVILLGSNWLYNKLGYSTAPPADKTQAAQKGPDVKKTGSGSSSAPVASAPGQPGSDAAPSAVAAAAESEFTLETSVYHVVFTNRGATVK